MPDTGSATVAALERAWSAIQAGHADVPDVLIVVGSGRRGRSSHQLLGHHATGRWASRGGSTRLPELFVAGELLGDGGAAIMETMLHEAAHALAATRGVQDTSRSGNRYHNRHFAMLASELGLTPPDSPSASLGYSDCKLSPAAAAKYKSVITSLDATVEVHLDRAKVRTDPGRFAVACACGRRLQVTHRSYRDGPIICGNCKTAFTRLPRQST